jgi:hypothetical protein
MVCLDAHLYGIEYTPSSHRLIKPDILRPARDWEILNCRLVTQHYKMH